MHFTKLLGLAAAFTAVYGSAVGHAGHDHDLKPRQLGLFGTGSTTFTQVVQTTTSLVVIDVYPTLSTSTVVATQYVTVSMCPSYVTDCPADNVLVVTAVQTVSTSICPTTYRSTRTTSLFTTNDVVTTLPSSSSTGSTTLSTSTTTHVPGTIILGTGPIATPSSSSALLSTIFVTHSAPLSTFAPPSTTSISSSSSSSSTEVISSSSSSSVSTSSSTSVPIPALNSTVAVLPTTTTSTTAAPLTSTTSFTEIVNATSIFRNTTAVVPSTPTPFSTVLTANFNGSTIISTIVVPMQISVPASNGSAIVVTFTPSSSVFVANVTGSPSSVSSAVATTILLPGAAPFANTTQSASGITTPAPGLPIVVIAPSSTFSTVATLTVPQGSASNSALLTLAVPSSGLATFLSQPSASAYSVVVLGPSTTISTFLGSAPSSVSTLTLGSPSASAEVFTLANGGSTTLAAQPSAFPVVVVSGSSTFTTSIPAAAAQTTSAVIVPITLSSDLVFAGPSTASTSLGAFTSEASFYITNAPATPTTLSFSTLVPSVVVVSSGGVLSSTTQQVPTIVSFVFAPGTMASETSLTPGFATPVAVVGSGTTTGSGSVATYTGGAANNLKGASGALFAGLVFALAA